MISKGKRHITISQDGLWFSIGLLDDGSVELTISNERDRTLESIILSAKESEELDKWWVDSFKPLP